MRILCVAAAIGLLPGLASGQKKAPRKPNVVILFIDDLGYGDTGPYGCKDIPTPNLDRLAREGVTCTASYITNPPCCPSRCSLIMGMYGQRFGKYGMSRGLPIPDDKPTLPEFMRDNGYVTGQIGKWDIGTNAQGPLARGFMEVAMQKPSHLQRPFIRSELESRWNESNHDQLLRLSIPTGVLA